MYNQTLISSQSKLILTMNNLASSPNFKAQLRTENTPKKSYSIKKYDNEKLSVGWYSFKLILKGHPFVIQGKIKRSREKTVGEAYALIA